MKIGVIISTYNNPEWLEKTLWGYIYQTRMADEIIIADDGSKEDTKQLIDRYTSILPIKHVWHKDNGFQKTQILNKALVASTAEYLIFTDQDCIPRKDFIETHERYAEKGYFLSGGYFKLPINISKDIDQENIKSAKAFSLKWLYAKGVKKSFKSTKLLNCKPYALLMNFITPAKASWNGCNSSGWREDMLAINGFNEKMKYGGEDREFGERLINKGIRAKQIRYSAIVLHLDHKRPYKNQEAINTNRAIRTHTKKNKIIVTPNGITKHE